MAQLPGDKLEGARAGRTPGWDRDRQNLLWPIAVVDVFHEDETAVLCSQQNNRPQQNNRHVDLEPRGLN